MREDSCPMCTAPIAGPGYLVAGERKYRRRWQPAAFLICGACYERGGPDPDTGLSRPYSTQQSASAQWRELVGRGAQMPPTLCAACGRIVVRRADPLLKRVTCSASCSTSLTRSRNGGVGSGQPCEVCGTVIISGRADSRYCGSGCRQRAYRRRVAAQT